MLAVGAVLALIFKSAVASWLAVAWVAVMIAVASVVVRRRASRRTAARIPWLAPVTVAAVLLSAAISLAVTFGLGVLPYESGLGEVIASLYTYYVPGVEIPNDEELIAMVEG